MTLQMLQFIRENLALFLEEHFHLNENKIIINRIYNADGSLPIENDNMIVLSLINVEQESYLKMQSPDFKFDKLIQPKQNNFNIYFLVSFNLKNYVESLKLLDAINHYFIETPFFLNNIAERFPSEINSIHVELYQTNELLNAKNHYEPTLLYKARIIANNQG